MNILLIQRFGVYHWQDYTFKDGTSKDKFFIALNCKIDDKTINLVLPTSQYEKRYEGSSYYLMDTVIVEHGESQYFTKKTVIDLKNIQNLKSNEIKIDNIDYKGVLEQNICNGVEQTIKNSKLLSPIAIRELLCMSDLSSSDMDAKY